MCDSKGFGIGQVCGAPPWIPPIDGVPYADRVNQQTQRTRPLQLVIEGTLPKFPSLPEKEGAGEGVHGFSFIQASLHPAPQSIVRHVIE